MKTQLTKAVVLAIAAIGFTSFANAQEGGGSYPPVPSHPQPIPPHPATGCGYWIGNVQYYWSYSYQYGWTCQQLDYTGSGSGGGSGG